jgi:hypothetical protein
MALDYVGDNLAADLTLVEIAREVGMSPYHFSRMFKLSTGLSPHQYVMRQRIERAKALLTNTDLPVGVVAGRWALRAPATSLSSFVAWSASRRGPFAKYPPQKNKDPTKDRKDSEAGWPAGMDTAPMLSKGPWKGASGWICTGGQFRAAGVGVPQREHKTVTGSGKEDLYGTKD